MPVAAARQGTGSGLLAKVVRAYRRRPDAAEVEIVFTRDQADLVGNGTADIALMCRHAPVDGLESSEVAEVQTVALLPLEHSFLAKPAVLAADLVQDELFRPLPPEDAAEIVPDEIIEKVAVGELAVTVGASATDRIGSAVVAVHVVDAPPTRVVPTWQQDVPAATHDAFVRTAGSVAAETWVPQPKAPNWVAPPSTTSSKPVMRRGLNEHVAQRHGTGAQRRPEGSGSRR